MNDLEQIAARKQMLIGRSDEERNDIARIYYRWQARTSLARQVTDILKNPLVLAGLGLFLLKMPWRRAYKMSGWGWRMWKLVRTIRRLVL
jgi:hypothetical protein